MITPIPKTVNTISFSLCYNSCLLSLVEKLLFTLKTQKNRLLKAVFGDIICNLSTYSKTFATY